MSGLVRRHARAKVDSPDELQRGLIGFYWAHAIAAARAMMPGRVWHETMLPLLDVPDFPATQWMEVEQANLRAAVEAAYRLGDFERVCQFCIALWPFYERGGHVQDMAAVNEIGVQAARERGDRLAEAVLGFQHGFAHRQRGDLDRAVQLFTAANEAAKRADSADAEATALESLGVAYLDQHDPRATGLLRRNQDLALELGDPRRIALARFHLAKALPAEEALPLLEQAWAGLAEEPHNAAKVELWRGKKLIEADRLEEAETALARVSAAVHREHGEALLALADVALARGDRAAEREQVRAAAQIFQRRGLTLLAVSAESRLAALD